MRVLLVCNSFDCLVQRLYAELEADGFTISVEYDHSKDVIAEAVETFSPDFILLTSQKAANSLTETALTITPCALLHLGPPDAIGDDPLAWAISEKRSDWSVSLIHPMTRALWRDVVFRLPCDSKANIYRTLAVPAAIQCTQQALKDIAKNQIETVPCKPHQQTNLSNQIRIRWDQDGTDTILSQINAFDNHPGMMDCINGQTCRVFDAHLEEELTGHPGEILAQRNGAICRATRDGAIWIGHVSLNDAGHLTDIKLPAAMAFQKELAEVQKVPLPLTSQPKPQTYRDLWYEERRGAGYIFFPFYNGAMSTDQCQRLTEAVKYAKSRPTRVFALLGGDAFFSSGIHLGIIEASADPAKESLINLKAMDELCYEVLTADAHFTIAALTGTAAAAGLFLALTTDYVFARKGVLLHPHGGTMAHLGKNAYWSYLLRKRLCNEDASAIVEEQMPLTAAIAQDIGLTDAVFGNTVGAFKRAIRDRAERLALNPEFDRVMAAKRAERNADEAIKPLQLCSNEDEAAKLSIFGINPGYDAARRDFLHKLRPETAPRRLARYRELKGCF